jgi:ribosome-binding protein aMBF1 (putative translation factor)
MAECSNVAMDTRWDLVRPFDVSPTVALGLDIIGQQVLRARRAAGLSQRQLGAMVELNQSTISRLENGLLRTFRLVNLARILGVLHDPLLGGPIAVNRWS